MQKPNVLRLKRRDLLKFGSAILLGGAAGLRPRTSFSLEPSHGVCPLPFTPEISECPWNDDLFVEFYPTSPFILEPFRDPLPVPEPLQPSTLSELTLGGLYRAPGKGYGQQAYDGDAFSTHSIWPTDIGLPDPVTYGRHYLLTAKFGRHYFTSSKVQPIDAYGNDTVPPDGIPGSRYLPYSVIWGYNGTFPGPMINAEYGKPIIVRFLNHLHLDRDPVSGEIFDPGDFGSPCRQILTHLHNAHTAPESDGNPHFRPHGYFPGEWVDNLYLNHPPDGDDREKQSFWWFHDHFEGYTGAQVYKGLVGLYPIYDPKLDPGDEKNPYGLKLPGVRRAVGRTFAVDYDIPLALFDCRLDDGVTPHEDFHNCGGELKSNVWGKTFFRHFPNRGFVGDVFTVNGKAYPCLEVKRRKYRFRILDASIARAYELKLMTANGKSPQPARGTQGQWLLPNGEQCMRFTQIASEGGLLPFPIVRNSIKLWPAKRREVIVDFSKYMDGYPTRAGEEIYLVNILKMEDGRKPDSDDPRYKVPILKFVITGDAEDDSEIPQYLRPLPEIRYDVPRRTFELERGGVGGSVRDLIEDPALRESSREFEWLINGRPFIPDRPLALLTKGQPEIWTITSGGGWGHPMHFHQEEHQTISRNGVKIPRTEPVTNERLADDIGKEDTVALDGSETVVIYRNFRTFPAYGSHEAKYVAHCHNLAHEDHSMMFGWSIVKKDV